MIIDKIGDMCIDFGQFDLDRISSRKTKIAIIDTGISIILHNTVTVRKYGPVLYTN